MPALMASPLRRATAEAYKASQQQRDCRTPASITRNVQRDAFSMHLLSSSMVTI
jgi:hypothetical protein